METETISRVKFTLNDAFQMVIYDLEYYKLQDKQGKDRIRNYRRFVKVGSITKDQKEKIVREYGFSCMQESMWKL